MVGLWHYNQSCVTELLIMRDPHYDRMCFKSVLGLYPIQRKSEVVFSKSKVRSAIFQEVGSKLKWIKWAVKCILFVVFYLVDGSPSTLWWYSRWPLYPGNEHVRVPVVTPATLIYNITPQAKIIAIFRDPTQRYDVTHLAKIIFPQDSFKVGKHILIVYLGDLTCVIAFVITWSCQ